MKNVNYLLLLICVTGCVRHVPLHGKYPVGPVYGQTEKSVDIVWNKLIDLITDEGLDLKFIDKSSGLAMSDELSFYTTQTTENKKGKPVKPDAYIITSRTDGVLPELFRVSQLSAKWSVVLRPLATGGTEIKAALANIEAKDDVIANRHTGGKVTTRFQAYSLQNFEKWLIEKLK
jgi:hypothetical protein